jgi:uncharacterized protein (DUF433 family)
MCGRNQAMSPVLDHWYQRSTSLQPLSFFVVTTYNAFLVVEVQRMSGRACIGRRRIVTSICTMIRLGVLIPHQLEYDISFDQIQ